MDFQIVKDSPVPLHTQLINELRRLILAGVLKPHSRVISEPQLASTLNISRTTIRQAWQAAEEEGLLYRVPGKGTYVAEPAEKRPSKIIGFLIPDFRSTFDSQLLSGAESYLRANGYRLMFAHTDRAVREENRLMDEMSQEGVQGFILWPALDDGQPRYLQQHADMPTVFIDRGIPGVSFPCVSAQHYLGAVQATEHLIGLGHTRIAFVTRPTLHLSSVVERLHGYEDTMRAAGLTPLAPVLVGHSTEVGTQNARQSYDESRGQEITQLQVILRRADHPTALFAVNDLMALQILRAASQSKKRVPEDVSVIGFDDIEFAAQVVPPLTTIAQDPFALGQEAARVLLDMIGGHATTEDAILLPTQLVVRASTAPPSGR